MAGHPWSGESPPPEAPLRAGDYRTLGARRARSLRPTYSLTPQSASPRRESVVPPGVSGRLALKVLAAGELVADKLPWIPDRTSPVALVGRAFTGAVSGMDVAQRDGGRPEAGAVLGAVSAVAASFAAYHLRRELRRRTHVP